MRKIHFTTRLRAAIVVTTLAMASSFAACGNDAGGAAGSEDATSSADGKITTDTESDADGAATSDTAIATDTSSSINDVGSALDGGHVTPDTGSAGDAGSTSPDAGQPMYCQLAGTSSSGGGKGGSGDVMTACPTGYFCKGKLGTCGGSATCVKKPDACPFAALPVCGCDGKTYSNICTAAAAGVTVSYNGKCGTTGTCTVPGKGGSAGFKAAPGAGVCGTGSYCGGSCGQSGSCKPRPTVCTKIYQPVCGCDGKTYSNPCMANAAGMSISYKTKCKVTTTCTVLSTATPSPGGVPMPPQQTCSAGQYCRLAANQCGGLGECRTVPTGGGCTGVYQPVCGCNGKTYSNACTANLAGINIASGGKCVPKPKGCCASSTDCAKGSACVSTGSANGGICKSLSNPTMNACWDDNQCGAGSTCVGSVVCPCGSACFAPDKQGTCQKSNAGKACTVGLNSPSVGCGANDYCKLSSSSSKCAGSGTCANKPQMCTLQYAPVCGCNGKTYGNACGAAGAGQNVSSVGACNKTP